MAPARTIATLLSTLTAPRLPSAFAACLCTAALALALRTSTTRGSTAPASAMAAWFSVKAARLHNALPAASCPRTAASYQRHERLDSTRTGDTQLAIGVGSEVAEHESRLLLRLCATAAHQRDERLYGARTDDSSSVVGALARQLVKRSSRLVLHPSALPPCIRATRRASMSPANRAAFALACVLLIAVSCSSEASPVLASGSCSSLRKPFQDVHHF